MRIAAVYNSYILMKVILRNVERCTSEMTETLCPTKDIVAIVTLDKDGK